MATVYLAEDLKHDRKVAVKVLRPELAAALGPDRFTREIRIAARLQHPHILPLLDSGQADGFLFYVMPYVDGQSLRDRLAREGELPVHEAVRLLVEITDALAFAHAQGVVHRDIKPDNILLSGRHALVMDFGVAKAVSEATGRHTLTSVGVALGTPAYMAPEQATADPNIDHRVDIYAVGVMAYELLSGRTPFQGLTPQQMLAAHVTEDPAPVGRYRPSLSPALQAVVMRCLAKHASDRWQTAQDLLAQLEPLMTPSGGMTPAQTQPISAATAPAPTAEATAGKRLLPWALLGGAVAVLAGGAVFLTRGRNDELALGRRTQVTRDPGLEMDAAISPDGKLVAYASGPSGDEKIYVRQIDGGGTVPLTPGVQGELRRPQWTPDGSRIAFQSPRGIELVPALGGVPRLLIASPAPDTAADLAWSPDGKRFVYRLAAGLFIRATDGGPSRQLAVGKELFGTAWSPDGRWIAYVAGNAQFLYGVRSQLGNLAPSAVRVVPAEGGTPVEVAGGPSLNLSPVWLPHGRALLFVSSQDGGRDIYRVALGSDGHPAAPARRLTTGLDAVTVSVTPGGRRLAYSAFTQTANVWAIDVPAGAPVSARTARPVTTGNRIIESFNVSADGKWLAFDSDQNGNQDIFRRPLAGGPEEQLTSDPGDDFQPHYSPDGSEIGFHAFRGSSRDVFVMPAAGGDAQAVVATPAEDRDPGWSPDGRRMSFSSDMTGRYEIYTVARQGSGWAKPVQLTHDGGIFPFWMPGHSIIFGWTRGPELVSPDDGKVTPLPMTGPLAGRQADAFAYTWAPDGRHVYAVVSGDTIPYQTLWSVPLDGEPPRPLVQFDDPLTSFGRGAFCGLGTTIYFTMLRSEADVWVAELSRP